MIGAFCSPAPCRFATPSAGDALPSDDAARSSRFCSKTRGASRSLALCRIAALRTEASSSGAVSSNRSGQGGAAFHSLCRIADSAAVAMDDDAACSSRFCSKARGTSRSQVVGKIAQVAWLTRGTGSGILRLRSTIQVSPSGAPAQGRHIYVPQICVRSNQRKTRAGVENPGLPGLENARLVTLWEFCNPRG